MKRFTDHQLKKILFAGILALTLVAAGAVLAQGPGRGSGSHRCLDGDFGSGGEFRSELRLERMAERLGLTQEQTEAITKIRQEGRQENLEIRKEMMRLRNELRGEMLKDDPSQKTVLELNDKLGELRTQRQANRLENRLAVREQLTPQQRDQMLLLGEFGKGSRHGRGGFREGRRGAGSGHFGNFGRQGGPGQGFGRGVWGDPDRTNFNR